jgi:hypothetical protein
MRSRLIDTDTKSNPVSVAAAPIIARKNGRTGPALARSLQSPQLPPANVKECSNEVQTSFDASTIR